MDPSSSIATASPYSYIVGFFVVTLLLLCSWLIIYCFHKKGKLQQKLEWCFGPRQITERGDAAGDASLQPLVAGDVSPQPLVAGDASPQPLVAGGAAGVFGLKNSVSLRIPFPLRLSETIRGFSFCSLLLRAAFSKNKTFWFVAGPILVLASRPGSDSCISSVSVPSSGSSALIVSAGHKSSRIASAT